MDQESGRATNPWCPVRMPAMKQTASKRRRAAVKLHEYSYSVLNSFPLLKTRSLRMFFAGRRTCKTEALLAGARVLQWWSLPWEMHTFGQFRINCQRDYFVKVTSHKPPHAHLKLDTSG